MPQRSRQHQNGFTLVELLIAVGIMALLTAASVGLVYSYLQAQEASESSSAVHQEALLAMERMTAAVKGCTYLHIPNGHSTTRQILAVSGMGNEDGDYYFGDPLFPRIDEDAALDMTNEYVPGIFGIDDDGDGATDEDLDEDDDEDGSVNEDPVDGVDNDGDGNIDEDAGEDMTADASTGILGMDDDGDGNVDEGSQEWDDDEDGARDEDHLVPRVFEYDPGLDIIREGFFDDWAWTWTSSLLCAHVTAFNVTYYPPTATRDPLVSIYMAFTTGVGDTLELIEFAYPRNILQKTGKRVR